MSSRRLNCNCYPRFLICNLHLFCFELITRERKGRNFFEENKSLTTLGGRGAIRDPTIFHKIFRYNFEFFPRKNKCYLVGYDDEIFILYSSCTYFDHINRMIANDW